MRTAPFAALAGAASLLLTAAAGTTPGGPANTSATESRWAHVLRPVTAREAPRMTARPVTRVGSTTPEGEPNLVLVVDGQAGTGSRAWLRVRLATLPAATAWMPRDALGTLHLVRTSLVVDRRRLRAVLRRNGRVVFSAPVGIGTPRWPTPRGEFYVRQKLAGFDDPFYGPVAFGTSGRSAVLTDWPGGGYIGIHGTDAPELLPGRVSHGCIRMRNADILRLAQLLPLGTPLTIT